MPKETKQDTKSAKNTRTQGKDMPKGNYFGQNPKKPEEEKPKNDRRGLEWFGRKNKDDIPVTPAVLPSTSFTEAPKKKSLSVSTPRSGGNRNYRVMKTPYGKIKIR